MSDLEGRHAEVEAARDTAGRRSGADRARLWASLNKYLGSEARHAQRAAGEEREDGREQAGGRRG